MKNIIFLLISFLPNSSLKAQGHYEEIIRFDNNDIKSIITYNSNDVLDGPTTHYHPNGLVKTYIEFIDGKANGFIQNYYPSGTLESTGVVNNDMADGLFYYYHPNQNLKQIILYNQNKIVDIDYCFDQKKNKLYCGKIYNGNGFINVYDKKGKLIARDQIENGIMIKRIEIEEDK